MKYPLLIRYMLWRVRHHRFTADGPGCGVRLAAYIGVVDGWYSSQASRLGKPEIVAEWRRTLPDFWRDVMLRNPL